VLGVDVVGELLNSVATEIAIRTCEEIFLLGWLRRLVHVKTQMFYENVFAASEEAAIDAHAFVHCA
jgi:hypothetical protein